MQLSAPALLKRLAEISSELVPIKFDPPGFELWLQILRNIGLCKI